MFKATAILLSALAATVTAGTVYVDNTCPFPVYLNSNANQNPPGPLVTLPANTINAYHEVQRGPDPSITLNTIRVDTQPNVAHPLIFTYNLTPGGTDYYALSTVFGDPLITQGFEVLSGGGGFTVACPSRTGGDCPHTYSPSNPNGNGAVFTQTNAGDFTFRLCRGDGIP